jgi:RNA polymerase sigma factor (sigma-70 family)
MLGVQGAEGAERSGGLKQIEVSIRLRNNLLKERRLALGMSGPQFARAVGVNYAGYVALEGMRASPLRKQWWDGAVAWTKTAEKLAAFHHCLPEDLWPEALLAIKQPEVTTKIQATELKALALAAAAEEPFALIDETSKEARQVVRRSLKRLTPREEFVIRRHFGFDEGDEVSLAEIAQDIDVSPGRTHQIKEGALRKLRDIKVLKEVV